MAQVRGALGPDALILATGRTSGGVEVTAGLDQPDDIAAGTPAALASAGKPSHRQRWGAGPAVAARVARRAFALARRLRAGPLPSPCRWPSSLTSSTAGRPARGADRAARRGQDADNRAARHTPGDAGRRPTMVSGDASVPARPINSQLTPPARGRAGRGGDGADLPDAMARRSGHGALLIDTAGHDPRCGDPSQVEAAEWVAAVSA